MSSDDTNASLAREAAEMEDELPALQADPTILHNPDLMISSDDDHLRPANISARFHRPALNRRRSSAASSRRNSLSSQHSQHSTKSYKLAVQSNHVAQHLRRVSFLESRKARLADKAAHAEQVRQRAALLKAAPCLADIEERAMAAARIREAHLEKVAAICKSEVDRARKVAEETKEKKAAEERRARLEMEEKHAEAERRRQEYLRSGRRPRVQSNTAADTKRPRSSGSPLPLKEVGAAVRIQRAWRNRVRLRAITKFTDKFISLEAIKKLSFMEASSRVADKDAIAATGTVMQWLGIGSQDEQTVRRFLSAFMIISHPSDVFNRDGQQEEDISTRAKHLLTEFEVALNQICTQGGQSPQPTQVETVSQAYSDYLASFAAWKERDATVLISTMVDQFVVFDAIWQTVKDDTRGEVAEDYRQAVRDQQVILLSKITKLAGHERAHATIKKAIRESRNARQRQRPVTRDARPREVASATAEASAAANASALDQEGTLVGTTSTADAERGELSRVFSIIPANRVVVHELLINPGYRIGTSAGAAKRDALSRKLCQDMKAGIERGDGEAWTVSVATNIRERLLKLLKEGNSLHRLVSEVLDIDHVRQQYRQGQFSYAKFFEFMADLLPRLCAPYRDQDVKAFADSLKDCSTEVEPMLERLFNLLRIIDLMWLDYSNYLLQQAAPGLVQDAFGYEYRAFRKDLEDGRITLTKTKKWWCNASVNLTTEATSPLPSGDDLFFRVHVRGIVDLAVSSTPPTLANIPETLHLDYERLEAIHGRIHGIILMGAILLTAKNLLKRDVRSQWKAEAKRIAELIAQRDRPDASEDTKASFIPKVVATISSSHNMPTTTLEHLTAMTTRFVTTTTAPAPFSDPVLKLLFQRLKTHIFARLSARTSAEKVRAASASGETLAGIGLSEFIGQIGEISEELGKVAGVDMRCHEEWYRAVAGTLESIGAAEH